VQLDLLCSILPRKAHSNRSSHREEVMEPSSAPSSKPADTMNQSQCYDIPAISTEESLE